MPIPAGVESDVLVDSLVSSEADRLRQAEGLVRDYCRWHVAPSRTETITLRPSGSAILILPSLRVTSVTSVTEDGATVDVGTYYLDTDDSTLVRTCGGWSTRPLLVTLEHGYVETPAAVIGVIRAVAQRAVDNPGSRPRDQVGPFADSFSQVGFNQAPALALLDAEKATLDEYRLPSRP